MNINTSNGTIMTSIHMIWNLINKEASEISPSLLDSTNLTLLAHSAMCHGISKWIMRSHISRYGKSDPIRMTRTERTEILPELTPEIIDLKFTRTENDPYRTKLDPNSFLPKLFFFSKKAYYTKNQSIRTENDQS